jgi:hypothetical protein
MSENVIAVSFVVGSICLITQVFKFRKPHLLRQRLPVKSNVTNLGINKWWWKLFYRKLKCCSDNWNKLIKLMLRSYRRSCCFFYFVHKLHRNVKGELFKNWVFPFGESNWCEVAWSLSTAELVNMKVGQCPIILFSYLNGTWGNYIQYPGSYITFC